MVRVFAKITKENFSSKVDENAQVHTDNQMQRKQNYFGVKYGNGKSRTERPNGLITWKKNCKESEKAQR